MKEPPLKKIKQLEFVELLAYFHGSVDREGIKNRFGVSAASATNILAEYNQRAPENLIYNTRLKIYEIGKTFKPLFPASLFSERISVSGLIPVYTMPKLFKPTGGDEDSVSKIALISRAIQKVEPLTIKYSSSSGVSTRQIVPVAFADNLLRWHLRAYDRKRGKFADFVLRRIQEVDLTENNEVQEHEHPNEDKEWHSLVCLKIKIHPHNIENTQSFSMGKGTWPVKIRAAMAGYFLQLWNVDCSPNAQLRSKEYQYILKNLKEISKKADLKLAPGYKSEK